MSNSSTLHRELQSRIATLNPGDKLPTSRDLMAEYGVGPGTVARVIASLVAEGVVVTRPGSGTFVAARTSDDPTAPDLAWQTVALADRSIDTADLTDTIGSIAEGTIMLNGGYLHPNLQPVQALSAALARAARRPDAWDRAPVRGLRTLCAIFAAAAGVTADDVLVTTGGQNALSMAFRAIAAPGNPVLVESPTYPGALAAARAAGLRPVPVPMDEAGVRTDLLAESFELTGARVFYCQPAFQNPTGVLLTEGRRREVLDVARAAGAFVIEDDFARCLGHSEPTPRPLLADDRHGTVVHVSSLTKVAAPSLRIGALIARGPVMERLRAIRQVDDFFIARPLQEAAVEFLTGSAWQRHLRVLGPALRGRRQALVGALEQELPSWTFQVPTGGLHLWVRLPHGVDALATAAAARREGVLVSPGHRYFATEPAAEYLRISFAAGADAAELTESVHRLRAAV